MRGEIKTRAIDAAIGQLEKMKGPGIFRPEASGYTRDPLLNLVDGVSKNDFWSDLAEGDGSELKDSGDVPAKFCAAHSSSALGVNVFGPFRHAASNLTLVGHTDFAETRFERKCPTGLRRKSPNLDFVASSDAVVVGVESKFLEILASKQAKFSDAYDAPMNDAGPGWQRAYDALRQDPGRFTMLDAAQLVKHHLGLHHTFGGTVGRIILLYVYWEPENILSIPEYQGHRREIAEFADLVAGDSIEFVAISHPQLWDVWERDSEWRGMEAHLRAVRARYAYPI